MRTSFIVFILLLTCLISLVAQNTKRVVVCELFTSSTCPPCASANPYFDQWYQGLTTLKPQIAVIKYHVWWPSPGNDPYYLANTGQNQTRNTYYGNNYVPHMYINGSVDAGATYSTWGTTAQTEAAKTSPLSVSISGNMSASGGTVNIIVTHLGDPLPSGSLVIHTVLTECGLLYTGTNGEPHHENVMRTMKPDASGESFALAAKEAKSFSRTITPDTSWKYENLELIAIVQESSSKQIVQASKILLKDIATRVEESPTVPAHFALLQNYPNPFNPATNFEFAIAKFGLVRLAVFDLLGREVAVLVNEQKPAGTYRTVWDASKVPSGVYFYRLKAGDHTQTKKMILAK